jgi:hypothetical protein
MALFSLSFAWSTGIAAVGGGYSLLAWEMQLVVRAHIDPFFIPENVTIFDAVLTV